MKRLHLSPGGADEERAVPSEAPGSLNRGLCEPQVGWTRPAGGVGGGGGQKTDRGLCLSWSPARSALYIRRTAPHFLRHTGGPILGGHVHGDVRRTLGVSGGLFHVVRGPAQNQLLFKLAGGYVYYLFVILGG